MKFYLEITLLPNSEVDTNFILSKTFQQLHLGLVEIKDPQNQSPIGISFPEYFSNEKGGIFGSKIRLFAKDESTLTKFDAAKWLSRLSDYVHCTNIRAVPEKLKGYAIYQRQQPKTNKERLARRYAKRHNMDYDMALNVKVFKKFGASHDDEPELSYNSMEHKTITTPFIRLKSLSGSREFYLWIKKISATNPLNSTYSTYGLSSKSTVPEF